MQKKRALAAGELERIRKLYQKIAEGDEILMTIKAPTGIMIVGKSNIGKTTMAHLIARSKLHVVDNLGLSAIDLEDPKSTKARIGMDGVSCTAIPNHFEIDFNGVTLHLYDCPGFCDSNKFESLISNAYYVYSTFLEIPQNLFVLTIPEEGLRNGAASGFIESVKLFLNYFEIDEANPPSTDTTSVKQKLRLEEIAQRTLLVISKARLPIARIIGLIQRFVISQQQNVVGEFSKFFQSEDKIDTVKEAEEGEPLPEQHILQKVCKMPYLDRRTPDGKVNMNVIKHRLAENELQATEMELANQAFTKCHEDILEMIGNLEEALAEMKLNYLTEKYQYKFFAKWHKTFNEISADKTKKNTVLKRPQTYPHFSTLKMFRKVYDNLVPLDGKSVTTEILQKTILSIVEVIAQLLPMNNAEFDILLKFIYLINRKYEETLVLCHIREECNPPNRSHLDKIKSFLTEDYEPIEKNMANKLVVKEGQEIAFYDEAIQILNKYKGENKELLKKISKCQMEKGVIKQNEGKLAEAIKGYVEAMETGEIYNAEANKAHYVNVDVELFAKIADLNYKIFMFRHALTFYKVINNTSKVLDCFEQLIVRKLEDPFTVRIEMGDYLISVVEFERAIRVFKLASDETNNAALKDQAHQKIIATYENKDNHFQQFKAKVQAKEFYNRLPTTFNKEKMLEDLAKAPEISSQISSIMNSDLVIPKC